MKILYFGTVCNEKRFNDICEKSSLKPSAAPQNYETLLINGFDGLPNVEIDANTFPPVPAFPKGYALFWGRKIDNLTENINTRWIPAINIQVIKQICFFFFSFCLTLLWLIKNRREKSKTILLYSIYMPVAYGTLFLAKLARCKTVVIVPDLPRFMFTYSQQKGIKAKLIPCFLYLTKIIESKFDGYILLAKYMNDLVNTKNKPYIIVEGIGNIDLCLNDYQPIFEDKAKKAIMYAGTLNEKFGIRELVEAFETIKDDSLELWLFGNGDMEKEIEKASQEDSRIRYFGRRAKKEILEYEKKATLLVNIRPTEDEYTKYSFPSKTIEYMASGTPLLTTKLPGIPEEYFSYCYTTEAETKEEISNVTQKIINLPNEELIGMGKKARDFIINNKNSKTQAKKIYNYLVLVLNNN